jgi:hypothetical protein
MIQFRIYFLIFKLLIVSELSAHFHEVDTVNPIFAHVIHEYPESHPPVMVAVNFDWERIQL